MKALILQNLVLAFSLLTALNTAGAMSTLRNGIHTTGMNVENDTEAGHCIGCEVSAKMSICEAYEKHYGIGCSNAVDDGSVQARVTNVALFNNGSEPERIYDLRSRPFASLNVEEKAILEAADKIGVLRPCDGVSINAFLIMYQGRPAIITTAHSFYDEKRGDAPRCSSLENARYYPNATYMNPDNMDEGKSFYMRRVELEANAINLGDARAEGFGQVAQKDYAIMFLEEDITKDQMPNGNTRSYLKYNSNPQPAGSDLYILGGGADPKSKDVNFIYQGGCNYTRPNSNRLNHDCHTIYGSSGSLLGHMQGGEIVFSASHRAAPLNNSDMTSLPSEGLKDMWNIGTSSQVIESRQ